MISSLENIKKTLDLSIKTFLLESTKLDIQNLLDYRSGNIFY